MTQSLEEIQGNTQQDWVCCSCVFGRKGETSPFLPCFQSLMSFFLISFTELFNPLFSVYTLYFPTPPCLFLLYLAIYQSPYLIPLSTLLLLSALTKCCGASAVGRFPVCYITTPSDSLNHCWARLARQDALSCYCIIKCCPTVEILSS